MNQSRGKTSITSRRELKKKNMFSEYSVIWRLIIVHAFSIFRKLQQISCYLEAGLNSKLGAEKGVTKKSGDVIEIIHVRHNGNFVLYKTQSRKLLNVRSEKAGFIATKTYDGWQNVLDLYDFGYIFAK